MIKCPCPKKFEYDGIYCDFVSAKIKEQTGVEPGKPPLLPAAILKKKGTLARTYWKVQQVEEVNFSHFWGIYC